MNKEEIVKILNDFKLRPVTLTEIESLAEYTQAALDWGYDDSDDDEEKQAKIDELGPGLIVRAIQGREDQMFTAEFIIHFTTPNIYVQSFVPINSYDNEIDSDEACMWGIVKPKTVKITIYESVS